jgi:hypothetical protein
MVKAKSLLSFEGMVLLAATFAPLTTGCAPERAHAVREARNVTLGLPGVSYRPRGSYSLGATFATNPRSVDTVFNEQGGDSVIEENEIRSVESRYGSISPFLQVFPWETSAFMIGLGATVEQRRYRFNEEVVGSTALAPQFSEVEYGVQNIYVGVPVGWAWIWESGFSFTLDVGPRWRVSRTMSGYTERGTVDEAKFTVTDTALADKVETAIQYGGSGILGYSF